MVSQMSNSDTPDDNDDRTPNEKKTGRTLKTQALDVFTVRQQLKSVEAMKAYDKYLKDHKRRLSQLEKIASGEAAPSSQSYL